MSLSRLQLIRATTSSPWTKDLLHLSNIPRYWLKTGTRRGDTIKTVPPRDRIKWWNVVPGDRIRIRGDKTSTIHEVLAINKFSNKVFLKGTTNTNPDPNRKAPPSKQVHYSRCQLYVGDFEYGNSVMKPVFAERLWTTTPQYVRAIRRWAWTRHIKKATPALPNWIKPSSVKIPWPTPEKDPQPQPGVYDTTEDEALAITYQIPVLPERWDHPFPSISEQEYLQTITTPSSIAFDPTKPLEVCIQRELSNPHSTANKQARWQAYQREVKDLLKSYVSQATKGLRGPEKREAEKEAELRWQMKVERDRRVSKARRSMGRLDKAKGIRKAENRIKREFKRKIKMDEMILKEAPNQKIPPSDIVSL